MKSRLEAQLDPEFPLERRSPNSVIPLANSQRRAWKHSQRSFGAIASAVRVHGPLRFELLQQSIDAVVQRHESLRTRIAVVNGTPRQLVDQDVNCQLEQFDLTHLPRNSAPDVRRAAEEFVAVETNLAIGPLFRAALMRLATGEHVLLLAVDHMVSDAISLTILTREIWTAYHDAARGRAPVLPPLALQFGDYAAWQERSYPAWLRKHGDYWLQRLNGAPEPRLVPDFPAVDLMGRTAEALHIPLGKKLSGQLREVARREQLILPLVVLTAYLCAAANWCRQRDLLAVFVSHGRHTPELESMVGNLASCLFFRVQIGEDDILLEVLRRVAAELACAYQHYDYDRVTDFVTNSETDIGFNWVSSNLGTQPPECAWDAQISLQPFPLRMTWVRGLLFFCSDTPAGITATILYRPDLFAKHTLERFANHIRLLARTLAEQPIRRVASVLKDASSS